MSIIHVSATRPPENGNKTDVRWATLTAEDGVGLLVSGDDLNLSAHTYTLENLTEAKHTPDLERAGHITLNAHLTQAGLGIDELVNGPSPSRCPHSSEERASSLLANSPVTA